MTDHTPDFDAHNLGSESDTFGNGTTNNDHLNNQDDIAAAKAKAKAKAQGSGPGASGAGNHKGEGLITVAPLKRNELQPSYAQDLGLDNVEHGFYGSLINCLGAVAGSLGQIPCCLCCPNPYKEVQQGSVGLISRFGQFIKSVDPGLVKVNPFSESLKVVDVKIQLTAIPKQTVMTKDNVNVQIDSVIYWHVSNPYASTFGIGDVRTALTERAQTVLRDVVGSRSLQSVVSDREGIAAQVEEIVEAVAKRWGVTIESLLIKDIIFSRELQESLSSAATQTRIGQSKIIAAKAEVESAKLMRAAADILSSPAALQIRELEALQAMAKSGSTKVIFVPMTLGSGSLMKESHGQDGMELTSPNVGASGSGGAGSASAPLGMGGMNVSAINQMSEM